MSWLPLKIPHNCKVVVEKLQLLQIVVSCTYEEGKPALMQDLKFLRQMVEDENQFLEVCFFRCCRTAYTCFCLPFSSCVLGKSW